MSTSSGPSSSRHPKGAGSGVGTWAWLTVSLLSGLGGEASAQENWRGFESLEAWEGLWQVDADFMRVEGDLLLLEGNVRAHGPAVEMQAEGMEIDSQAGRVVLSGNVVLREGRAELRASSLELDQAHSLAVISQVRIAVKRTGGRGGKELQVESGRLVYRQKKYRLENASLTTCDCGPEAPSWRICARRAEVEPQAGAWLEWPLLRVKEIPLLMLPVAYLPLSERRSGLLFPQLNYSGRDGFVVSEALFITLGRSADATLNLDWFEERGWRERLELRARPSQKSGMELTFSFMMKDAKLAAAAESEKLARRWAWEGSGWVDGQVSSLRASARLYSDSDFFRDFASEMAGRAQDVAVSTVLFENRGRDWLFSADAAFLQDLRFAKQDLFSGAARDTLGPPDTLHRLGAASWHWAPTTLGDWPLEFSGLLELANLSSLSAAWRDWGPDGLPDAFEPRYAGNPAQDRAVDNHAGDGDGKLGTGELRRALRLLVEPRLLLRTIWAPLGMEFSVWHRQLGYLPHGPDAPEPSTRGLSFASFSVWSELARSYGDWGHRLRPRVELAAAWRGLESANECPYLDIEDRLLDDVAQAVVGLDNFLATRTDGGPWTGLLDFSFAQGFDMRANRLGQLSAEIRLRRSNWGLKAYWGWDWRLGRPAEIQGGTYYTWPGWLHLDIDYLYLPVSADAAGRPVPISERLHRELGLPQGSSVSWLHGLGEAVQAFLWQGSWYVGGGWRLLANGLVDLDQLRLGWTGGGLIYDSPCRCWGLQLTVRHLRGQDYPDVFLLLEVAGVTTAAGGTNSRF